MLDAPESYSAARKAFDKAQAAYKKACSRLESLRTREQQLKKELEQVTADLEATEKEVTESGAKYDEVSARFRNRFGQGQVPQASQQPGLPVAGTPGSQVTEAGSGESQGRPQPGPDLFGVPVDDPIK
eukprot:939633-Lingulodinium_polyedra.AAC.1